MIEKHSSKWFRHNPQRQRIVAAIAPRAQAWSGAAESCRQQRVDLTNAQFGSHPWSSVGRRLYEAETANGNFLKSMLFLPDGASRTNKQPKITSASVAVVRQSIRRERRQGFDQPSMRDRQGRKSWPQEPGPARQEHRPTERAPRQVLAPQASPPRDCEKQPRRPRPLPRRRRRRSLTSTEIPPSAGVPLSGTVTVQNGSVRAGSALRGNAEIRGRAHS